MPEAYISLLVQLFYRVSKENTATKTNRFDRDKHWEREADAAYKRI